MLAPPSLLPFPWLLGFHPPFHPIVILHSGLGEGAALVTPKLSWVLAHLSHIRTYCVPSVGDPIFHLPPLHFLLIFPRLPTPVLFFPICPETLILFALLAYQTRLFLFLAFQKPCPNPSFLQVLYSFNPTTLDIAATGSPLHTRPTDPLGPLKPLPRISSPRDFESQKHHTHTKTSTARLRVPGLHEPQLCEFANLRSSANSSPFSDRGYWCFILGTGIQLSIVPAIGAVETHERHLATISPDTPEPQ